MNGPLRWLLATVSELHEETAAAKTITFEVPGWQGHLAGQHVDIRLTAADGYVAQRSYSLASPAGRDARLQLTVERVRDGEVSPFYSTSFASAIALSCAARSAGISPGRRRPPDR
jgi:ferredoxin-NADP reductase